MNSKKAVTVTWALVFMLGIIITGLWFLKAYVVFAIVVGLLAGAGVAYLAALLVEWLTTDKEIEPPAVVLGDDIETTVGETVDDIVSEMEGM